MAIIDQEAKTQAPPEKQWQAWIAGKEFVHKDYVSNKIREWSPILGPFREREVDVLEIGSLEGRSAIFFLNYLPKARVTCVDKFPKDREKVFDRNLSEFRNRLEKLSTFSAPALVRLRQKGRKFDLIYIDGDHRREAVMLDSVLSWPMLRAGGILIWDDYVYKEGEPLWERPAGAIDGFLVAHAGEYEELHRRKQVIVRKTVEAPDQKSIFGLYLLHRRRPSWRQRLRRLWRGR